MNRRGMALLTTLWLLAALSAVAGAAMATARVERGAALNAMALARGRWGAEGCLAVLQAQMAVDSFPRDVDSTDLGAGVWCRARVVDADARVGLDQASPELLERLIGDPARTAALLDWMDADDVPRAGGAEAPWYRAAGRAPPRNGPLASVDELYEIAGFDSALVERLRPLVSARGSGKIAVNAAPVPVLEAIPGFEPATVTLLLQRRADGRPPRDLDDLLGGLPPSLRAPLLARYGDLQGMLTFRPARIEIHLEGHVAEASIVSTTTLIAIPVPGRVAILSREAW